MQKNSMINLMKRINDLCNKCALQCNKPYLEQHPYIVPRGNYLPNCCKLCDIEIELENLYKTIKNISSKKKYIL